MVLDELIGFVKKKGFRDVFTVLTKHKNYMTDKHTFYNELNQFSYYNSFFRIKEEMIEKGLLTIEQNNKKKYFQLTEKGITVYNKLLEVNDLLNHKSSSKKKKK